MTWLIILKNYIAYRDQVNCETKHVIETNVMSSPLPWSTFFSKTDFGKKLETAWRKRTEWITHSTHRKRIPDILLQISNLTSNHSRVRVLGRIYWMPHSLTAFCLHVEDMMPPSYASKIRARLLSSVTFLSSHWRGCTTDRWHLRAIDEAELVPMYACVGGL